MRGDARDAEEEGGAGRCAARELARLGRVLLGRSGEERKGLGRAGVCLGWSLGWIRSGFSFLGWFEFCFYFYSLFLSNSNSNKV